MANTGEKGPLQIGGKADCSHCSTAVSCGLQSGFGELDAVAVPVDGEPVENAKSADGRGPYTKPEIAFADNGVTMTYPTTRLRSIVYASPVRRKGIVAGGAIEGARIIRIEEKALFDPFVTLALAPTQADAPGEPGCRDQL